MKLVLPERGTPVAETAWSDAERILSSRLLYPEARAALGRARRTGRVTARELRQARERVDRLWLDVERVDVTAGIAHTAGDLAERYALRAYDAVHLASALLLADEDLALVSADRGLLDAATASGLSIAGI